MVFCSQSRCVRMYFTEPIGSGSGCLTPRIVSDILGLSLFDHSPRLDRMSTHAGLLQDAVHNCLTVASLRTSQSLSFVHRLSRWRVSCTIQVLSR